MRRKIAAAIKANDKATNTDISRQCQCARETVRNVRRSLEAGHGNLIAPAEPGNDRAAKHGAYREVALAPIRTAKLADLQRLYPHAPPELLLLQANRAAQLELIWMWQENRGVIRDSRHGSIYPAAVFAERLSTAYENALGKLAELERQARAERPSARLEALAAELSEGEAA